MGFVVGGVALRHGDERQRRVGITFSGPPRLNETSFHMNCLSKNPADLMFMESRADIWCIMYVMLRSCMNIRG